MIVFILDFCFVDLLKYGSAASHVFGCEEDLSNGVHGIIVSSSCGRISIPLYPKPDEEPDIILIPPQTLFPSFGETDRNNCRSDKCSSVSQILRCSYPLESILVRLPMSVEAPRLPETPTSLLTFFSLSPSHGFCLMK